MYVHFKKGTCLWRICVHFETGIQSKHTAAIISVNLLQMQNL